jgi:hypothetical protein
MSYQWTTVELVRKLIGPINPVGETNLDEKRLPRIQEVSELAEDLLGQLVETARFKDRHEASMRRAGEDAWKCLENIYGWLGEVMEKGEDDERRRSERRRRGAGVLGSKQLYD